MTVAPVKSGRTAGAPPSKAARAGAQMAVATLAMAGASGIQAVLYLSKFGVNARTDAFFAAFSLYAVFGVFCQSIRLTSVPLLVGESRRLRGREFAATLALVALPVIVLCEPLAPVLAQVLAPGANAATRTVTAEGLRILGGAMVLQLAAAGAATLLGLWDAWGTVAGAYIAGAVGGLATYLAVAGSAGELSLGWSMLAMGAVTFAWLAVGLERARTERRPGGVGRPGGLAANGALILGRTVVYFAINGLYLVTLAFASHEARGNATVLSYAYLYASYLVAGTSVAVGISRVADMTRGSLDDWSDVVADTVPHGYRYAMLVSAPALAGLVAAGAALIGAVLPHSLPADSVTTLERFGALLVPWTIAALLVNFALPALFAMGRARLVNLLALPVIALHVLATVVGQRLFGVDGVVGAFFVAPSVFAVVLLWVGAGHKRGAAGREIALDTARFALPATGAFGLAWLLGSLLSDDLARSLVVGVLGCVLYIVAVRFAAPRQVGVLLGARRAAGPTDTAEADAAGVGA